MKCQEIQNLLSDYVDEELSASAQETVQTHLQTCSDCRKVYVELKQLTADLAAIPKEMKPDEDLWPAINDRLKSGKKPKILNLFKRYKSYLSAAAVAVFFISSFYVMLRDNPDKINQVTRELSPQMQSAVLLIKEEYTQTREKIQKTLSNSQGEISPETIQTIEYNLKIIDEATRNIQQALQENGADKDLMDLYYQSYMNQVKLLQQTLELLKKQKRRQI